MSSGYNSNYADVIKEEQLLKIGNCGKLIEEIKGFIELDELAQNVEHNSDSLDEEVQTLYTSLEDEFKKETGLELIIGYHDPDNGDSADEVSGYYWSVDGMYVLSDAGKKFKDAVERKFFVSFG